MSKRTTYRKLLSPFAQIEGTEDFIGQMEAMVGDTWEMRDTPEDTARANSESALEFLYELREGEITAPLLGALKTCGLRFESDGEEEDEAAGVEGYFRVEDRGSSLDFFLHHQAFIFHLEVAKFAPDGWSWNDTTECLGWENLVVVPDEGGIVSQGLELVTAEPDRDVLLAFIEATKEGRR